MVEDFLRLHNSTLNIHAYRAYRSAFLPAQCPHSMYTQTHCTASSGGWCCVVCVWCGIAYQASVLFVLSFFFQVCYVRLAAQLTFPSILLESFFFDFLRPIPSFDMRAREYVCNFRLHHTPSDLSLERFIYCCCCWCCFSIPIPLPLSSRYIQFHLGCCMHTNDRLFCRTVLPFMDYCIDKFDLVFRVSSLLSLYALHFLPIIREISAKWWCITRIHMQWTTHFHSRKL